MRNDVANVVEMVLRFTPRPTVSDAAVSLLRGSCGRAWRRVVSVGGAMKEADNPVHAPVVSG
ncbi:hypothetical protein GS491_23710 [Rhodococcus hoagii]|nr:hypothetical protein [Prescottella equi]